MNPYGGGAAAQAQALQQQQPQQISFANSYHTANCVSTGNFCSGFEACCSKLCRIAKGKQSRVCCLGEGAVCDPQNPGLAICCAGLMCMPVEGTKVQGLTACQTMK